MLIAAGLVVAALGKSAQLPFSFWLSRAMEGPSPVSALLHSATMVAAGAYLLLRLAPLLAATGWAATVSPGPGAVTAVVLGLVAVAQRDLKQLLAASTCAQVGFMVLAAGAGGVARRDDAARRARRDQGLLFLAAGAWLAALGTKSLPGAARRRPPLPAGRGDVHRRRRGARRAAAAVAVVDQGRGARRRAARQPGPVRRGPGRRRGVGGLQRQGRLVRVAAAPADVAAGYDTERHGTRRVAPAMRPPLCVLAILAAVLGVLAVPAVAGPLGRALGVTGEPSPAVVGAGRERGGRAAGQRR